MAMAWPPPNIKPKLKQEEFDEAVKTNIEDFDMSPEEAVKSAADEFALQGYDLSAVVKTAAGGDLAQHPIALATQAISEAGGDAAALSAAVSTLQQLMNEAISAGQDSVQEVGAVALKASTLGTLLGAIGAASEGAASSGSDDASKLIQAGLAAARTLMAPSLDIRDTFDEVGGPALVMRLHERHAGDVPLQAELARCAECAAFREEQNKEQLMEVGYGISLLKLLASHCDAALAQQQQQQQGGREAAAAASGATMVSEGLVGGCCGVLRALCTADDDRPPSSKAFQTARVLARQHQALRVLLSVLRVLPSGAGSAPTVAAVLSTVRQLAANEEICKDFSDDGGVTTCLKLISALCTESREVVRCGLGALRQLTHADHTKLLLAERHAAELLMQVSAAYPQDAEVLEPALGVMANMTLRQPEVVTQCVAVGVAEWLLQAMRDNPTSSIVQRQSAILLRNMVVRNTENRPLFLDGGAEALLRAAKKAHPRNCTDVGSAALRDLGLDNYNE